MTNGAAAPIDRDDDDTGLADPAFHAAVIAAVADRASKFAASASNGGISTPNDQQSKQQRPNDQTKQGGTSPTLGPPKTLPDMRAVALACAQAGVEFFPSIRSVTAPVRAPARRAASLPNTRSAVLCPAACWTRAMIPQSSQVGGIKYLMRISGLLRAKRLILSFLMLTVPPGRRR